MAGAQPNIDDTIGLNTFGSNTNLVQAGGPFMAKYMVVQAVNVLLSFLGMLFTVLIIYGGFRWMLSQGNSQQVDEAKEIIKNAVIGLAIVLLSYVISRAIMGIFDSRNMPAA